MSREAAEAQAIGILEPINIGIQATNSSMMTLSEFIDSTFLDVKKEKWREDSTQPTNIGILNNHLRPALGSKLIHLITRRELQDLLQLKAKDQMSYSLVQHLHSFMGEIFEMALADRLIQVNPARSVIIPKCKPPKPKPVMTPEQIESVVKVLDIRERLIFWLATPGGGMRPGEVTGLTLGDIGEDRIFIRRRIYRGREGEVKTRRSEREVPITPRTAALIGEYRKLLIDSRPAAWLFPSENPKRALIYSNVFRRKIKPALIAIGLGHINFQAMRRTFASQSHAGGVNAKTRSDIMGNTVDVNENEYTQTPFDVKKKAMSEVEERLLH